MKPECLKVKLKKNLRLKSSYTNEGILKHAVKFVLVFQAANLFFFTKLIDRLPYDNPNFEILVHDSTLRRAVNRMQELQSCNTWIVTLAG